LHHHFIIYLLQICNFELQPNNRNRIRNFLENSFFFFSVTPDKEKPLVKPGAFSLILLLIPRQELSILNIMVQPFM